MVAAAKRHAQVSSIASCTRDQLVAVLRDGGKAEPQSDLNSDADEESQPGSSSGTDDGAEFIETSSIEDDIASLLHSVGENER